MKKNPTFLVSQDKVNETQRKSLGFGEYKKRDRLPAEALPRTMSFKTGGVFDPSRDLVSRCGLARS